MIEREINFVVGQDGKVTCDGSLRPQLAGVQGDRNECTLNFDLTAIYNGNFNYFIEFVSGSGVPYMLSTDSEGVSWNLANHTLSVLLGAEITADGGQVEVNIVEERIDSENETAIEGNTYTTYIYFEPKSGAIQKLRNTAYGIFFDIKIKVAEFTSSITQAFSNFTSSISSEVSNLENSVNTLDEKIIATRELVENYQRPENVKYWLFENTDSGYWQVKINWTFIDEEYSYSDNFCFTSYSGTFIDKALGYFLYYNSTTKLYEARNTENINSLVGGSSYPVCVAMLRHNYDNSVMVEVVDWKDFAVLRDYVNYFNNKIAPITTNVSGLQTSVSQLSVEKQDNLNLGDGLEFVDDYDEQAEPIKVLKVQRGETTTFNGYGGVEVDTDIIATKAFVRAVNDLANYYLKSETYTKTEVNQLIGAIPKFKIEVVNQLPTTDISTATVYLVTTGTESQNLYTEYIYVNNAWEKLGTQTVDLTGYATQTWVNSQIADFLTANEISYAISTALNNYYNKSEIDGLLDYKVNIGTFNDLAAAVEDKVNKETGKGLSTNDFTNDYKSKIETNEYNDIFNIRVEWDRKYMPHFELIRIYFQYYESGRLAEDDPVSYDVKDITNGNVYLYKDIFDQWAMAVGTPPSSYHRLPMLVGNIATKTVNGESIKLFFRNDDDEAQFDKLNSEKVDKEGNWELINDITVSEADLTSLSRNVDDNGNELKLKGIRFFVYCPSDSRATASTLLVSAYANTNFTGRLGRLYRQNIIGRSNTKAFFQCKVENGYWYDSYEVAQGIEPITGITYRTEFLDANYYNRINENNNPFIKLWQLGINTIPVGTTIKVYGIKEQ